MDIPSPGVFVPALATDHQGKTGEIFWAEIAPSEHLVHIYSNDSVFLDMLEGFVAGGLAAGEAIILIATPAHRAGLEQRLVNAGNNLPLARRQNRYLALDAERALAKFMMRGWPDDILFKSFIEDLLQQAGAGEPVPRRVRAFGEMVALLWQQGYTGATVRLEYLWQQLCNDRGLSLFCAYPKLGFTQPADISIKEICSTHSKVIHDHPPHE
jgi:hypothetical protein